jgi:hypothetical protein
MSAGKSERGVAYIIFKPLRLEWPSRPTMRWSCTTMPKGCAIAMISCVMRMSAFEGAGSPEG